MYHQQNHGTDYGGVEKIVLPTNGHFIDPDPTMVYRIRVRDAAQAYNIFKVYLGLYGDGSRRHVSIKGNILFLSTEGLSRLEKCARTVGVYINSKDADFIRRNGR